MFTSWILGSRMNYGFLATGFIDAKRATHSHLISCSYTNWGSVRVTFKWRWRSGWQHWQLQNSKSKQSQTRTIFHTFASQLRVYSTFVCPLIRSVIEESATTQTVKCGIAFGNGFSRTTCRWRAIGGRHLFYTHIKDESASYSRWLLIFSRKTVKNSLKVLE